MLNRYWTTFETLAEIERDCKERQLCTLCPCVVIKKASPCDFCHSIYAVHLLKKDILLCLLLKVFPICLAGTAVTQRDMYILNTN